MSSFKDLVQSHPLVLVDFSAEWCQPCKMLQPILKEVAQQMGDRVRILKIDIDKNAQLAGQLGIQSVPTLIAYRSGEQVWRSSGALPAHNLVQQLNELEQKD